MVVIISLVATFVIIWVILESVTIIGDKLWNTIHGSGLLLLEKELNNSRLNRYDNNIIVLEGVSELKGDFISNSGTSIIFPYYLIDNNDICYGIARFSKAYFIVKDKYKKLKESTPTKKHLKFY